MLRQIDFSTLMKAADINFGGTVNVNENMSGLEPNPKDDWLFLGVLSIKHELQSKDITTMACIGSANGIDVIAALKSSSKLRKIFVTDILPEILPEIKKNIEQNALKEISKVELNYVAGRDCEPLPEKVDFIYANLPLIMVESNSLDKNLATTTLTDARNYSSLSNDQEDPLYTWSLLSQLGFLLSAKEKLNADGVIVTLIGGRIPYNVIDELFKKSGFQYKELYCSFKLQSDPTFLKEYADYETAKNVEFCFYDYEKAAKILKDNLGITIPDVIKGKTGEELKEILSPAQINAVQAYNSALNKKPVGHLAHAFEATI